MNFKYEIGQWVRCSNEDRNGRIIRLTERADRHFYDVIYHGGHIVNRIPEKTLVPTTQMDHET